MDDFIGVLNRELYALVGGVSNGINVAGDSEQSEDDRAS